jgi:hypothetical protein
MLAALNHPHIGAIDGLEESEGVRALVLELVDARPWRIVCSAERWHLPRRSLSRGRSRMPSRPRMTKVSSIAI